MLNKIRNTIKRMNGIYVKPKLGTTSYRQPPVMFGHGKVYPQNVRVPILVEPLPDGALLIYDKEPDEND